MTHPSKPSLLQIFRAKRWPISALARYLGVSRQHIYNVIKHPPAGELWSCVAEGLPRFTPEIAATIPPPEKRKRFRMPKNLGFEVGDGFTCMSENDFAQSGQSGFIAEISKEKPLKALLRMPHAEVWLTPDDLFQFYAPNGRTHPVNPPNS